MNSKLTLVARLFEAAIVFPNKPDVGVIPKNVQRHLLIPSIIERERRALVLQRPAQGGLVGAATFPLLFNQNLNASQHIVHHHIGGRLDALGSSGLKINGADLIAQHDTLRLSS